MNAEPRAVDPHCFDADPDPDQAQNLDADTDPDPDPRGGGRGVGQPKMCIPPCKILGTPLSLVTNVQGRSIFGPRKYIKMFSLVVQKLVYP